LKFPRKIEILNFIPGSERVLKGERERRKEKKEDEAKKKRKNQLKFHESA
jgi:hypothetical protein